jgi:hypothetical protein
MRRLLIVRSGAVDVYERLRRQFARDPATVIIYDRRSQSRRRGDQAGRDVPERRRRERRLSYEIDVLRARGFYTIHNAFIGTGAALAARSNGTRP